MSLLGDTRASDKELQRSVNGILARLQEFDRASYELRISRLEQEISEGDIRLKGLEQTLRESRAAETEVLDPVFGYQMCIRDSLLATHDGRNAEAARMIYEQRIAQAFDTTE